MYGKARTEGARYICPQCFTAHYRNDVLFGTQRLTDSCDRRQAAFRYALGPRTAFARWCGGGKNQRPVELADAAPVPPPMGEWCDYGGTGPGRPLGNPADMSMLPHAPFFPLSSGYWLEEFRHA